MERVYVSLRKEARSRNFNFVLLLFLSFGLFILIFFFMTGAYNDVREELIVRLRREKEAVEMNKKLKMELSVITRGRYLELKANERLGLKKPREEEVLVLR